MTPVWRSRVRASLHGLTAAHDRSHIARAILEGLAFASRDVAHRLVALGLPADGVVVLGGGGRSGIWTQIRADTLGLPHRVAARTDTCAVGAAMIAAVAVGALPDLAAAAALAPAHNPAVFPQRSLDEAYERYRDLVMRLVTTMG
jgi:sugar (pentulose or hexulose) kinase